MLWLYTCCWIYRYLHDFLKLWHHKSMSLQKRLPSHWSPTVSVSLWLPEPARDRRSKQKTLNGDCYHTTRRSAAIFGVQTVLSYLVLALNLWIGLCPMKRSSDGWSFDEVSVTYRRSFGNHTLAWALCSGNTLPEPAFSFTTVPLFYRAQLNSVPICMTALWLIYSLDIFWHLCRHVNSLKVCLVSRFRSKIWPFDPIIREKS